MINNILQQRKYSVHTDTRNISFIQTAKDLKVLGIKNHYFFLKLYDTSLRKVDPYSPFLTEDIMIRILNECVINPWYFIRECSKIPDQGGKGIPFLLSRGNLADIWCFLNGIPFYDIKPRQTGKTQSNLAILLWSFLFGTSNSEFMFIGKDQEFANLNLDRLKKQRELLPTFMQFKKYISEEGKAQTGDDNVKSISNVHNNNKIVTKPRAASAEKAEGIGRGCSQPIHLFDEVEFTPHIKTIIEASGPAYAKAATNAKRNGAIYGRILLSTPGDLDSAPAKEAMEIVSGMCKWSETFYDKKIGEVEEYIEKSSTNNLVYIEYNHKQLGLDDEWVKETAKSLLNNPIKIKREIYLKRIRGSEISPFDQEDLEAIDDLRGEVKEEIYINKFFKLDIYTRLERSKVYIVAVDVGTGTGNDKTAVTIIDPYSETPVAELESPYISTEDIKKILGYIVRKLIPRGILCIERNHVGAAVIEGLKETGYNANLYFDHTKELTGNIDDGVDSKGFLKQQAFNRRLYGVYTEKASRELMMNILFERVAKYKGKFICNGIINDLLNLTKNKNGKIEALSGQHDDNIMSFLIGLYVLYYGNNLERYGFVRGHIPDADERGRGLTFEEEEVYQSLGEEFQPAKFQDTDEAAIRLKLAEEVQRAKNEIDLIDKITFNSGNYKNVDDMAEFDASIPMDFFAELND